MHNWAWTEPHDEKNPNEHPRLGLSGFLKKNKAVIFETVDFDLYFHSYSYLGFLSVVNDVQIHCCPFVLVFFAAGGLAKSDPESHTKKSKW